MNARGLKIRPTLEKKTCRRMLFKYGFLAQTKLLKMFLLL